MKFKNIFFLTTLFLTSLSSFSQVGKIELNQDSKLTELMKLKKEVNEETFTSGQFTIQVYNGQYEGGVELMEKLIFTKTKCGKKSKVPCYCAERKKNKLKRSVCLKRARAP